MDGDLVQLCVDFLEKHDFEQSTRMVSICLDDAAGGDLHIICTLDHVYHAEHLKELCRLASWVLSGGKNG